MLSKVEQQKQHIASLTEEEREELRVWLEHGDVRSSDTDKRAAERMEKK